MDYMLLVTEIFLVIGVFRWAQTGIEHVDKYYEYNNMQLNYIKPPIWSKKLFRLKSKLLPRWVIYRFCCFTLACLLSIPAIIAYIIHQNDRIFACSIAPQCFMLLFDTATYQIFYKIYEKKKKKTVSLSEALNYPETTPPPEDQQ